MARETGFSGELVAFEQGFEHRPGDDVLGQHLDGVAFGDGVVQIVAQFAKEGIEGAAGLGVRVFQQGGQAGDVVLGDFGDGGLTSPPNNRGCRTS
jgi:hypothetical protein